MSFIEFLDAHFIGMALTVIAVVAINQIGRCVLAKANAKTIERTFRH